MRNDLFKTPLLPAQSNSIHGSSSIAEVQLSNEIEQLTFELNQPLRTQSTERFYSRGQHTCKFTETNVYIRKEFNSQRLVWYTNMAAVSLFWNTNLAAVTSCENALSDCVSPLGCAWLSSATELNKTQFCLNKAVMLCYRKACMWLLLNSLCIVPSMQRNQYNSLQTWPS